MLCIHVVPDPLVNPFSTQYHNKHYASAVFMFLQIELKNVLYITIKRMYSLFAMLPQSSR